LKKAKFWIILSHWRKGFGELVQQQTTASFLWNQIEDFASTR
jgi:hypothetical protein